MSGRRVNILITGTPGCGKTCLASQIAERSGLKHIDVSQMVKEKGLYEGFDEEFQSYTLDEDKVCDELEPIMSEGGVVADMHSNGFFPERWFDLVLVLRCDTNQLWGRLEKRGYRENKIKENIECEIMQVCLEEARESYKEDIIWEVQSNTVEEMEANTERVLGWLREKGYPTM